MTAISPFIFDAQTLSITAGQIASHGISLSAFRTIGYAAPGDGGDALYTRGTSSGPMAAQDASGQWWQLALTGQWSCKAWGAKGDGSTNDTTALNNWLAACVTYQQIAFAPVGIYMHTGLVLDARSNGVGVAFGGVTAGLTIFRTMSGTTNPILTYYGKGGYGNQSRCFISNLTLDGNNKNSGHGLFLNGNGDSYDQGPDLFNVTIFNAGQDGIYVGPDCNAGTAYNVSVSHPGRNAVNLFSADWKWTSCLLYGADNAGIAVTNAINNGSGLVRLTVPNHGLTAGMTARVWGVNGATGAQGNWTPTIIDANTLDLPGSTFGGAYTSGGRFVPVWSIAGVADNGSGVSRVQTSTSHNLATGAQVFLSGMVQTPKINGGFVATVIDAAHFDLQSSTFTAGYTSGGTVESFTASIYVSPTGSAAGQDFYSCNMYSNMFGVVITNPSASPICFIGGSIDTNWRGGVIVQTFGVPSTHTFSSNIHFTGNSTLVTGTYPDVFLTNTGNTVIAGEYQNNGTTQSSYLLQTDGTCSNHCPVQWIGSYDTSGSTRTPFSLHACSLTSDSNVPYGARASIASGYGNLANTDSDVGGQTNNGPGMACFVRGRSNTMSGQYSAGFGSFANDQAEPSIVYGNGQFVQTGDNQVRLSIAGGATTANTTATRCIVGSTSGGAASTTTTFNLFFNFQSTHYPTFRVMGHNPATGDTVVFSVSNLVAKRGSSASAITLNGSSSTINMTQVYADSALASCTATLAPDTTNSGIAVTVTGIAATTLHWEAEGIHAMEIV